MKMASFKSFILGLFLVIFSLSSFDVGYASRKLFQVQSSNVLENLKQTLNELQKHINSPDPPREVDLKQIASLLKQIRDLLPKSDSNKPTKTSRRLQSSNSRLFEAMENSLRKRKLQNLAALPPPPKYPRFSRPGQTPEPNTPRPPISDKDVVPVYIDDPYYKRNQIMKGNGAGLKSSNPSGATNQASRNVDPSTVQSDGSRRLSTLLTISNGEQSTPVEMSTTPELPLLPRIPHITIEGLPRVRVEGVPPLENLSILRHLPKSEELPIPILTRPDNPSWEETPVDTQVSQPLDQGSGNTRIPNRLLLATRRHLLSSTGPQHAGNGGMTQGIMSTYTFNQMMNSKVNHGPKKKSH